MEERSFNKALDIVGKLIVGEEVGQDAYPGLYNDYSNNPEVYDIVCSFMKKLNLSLYEYRNTLYVTAGENNRIFGYSNEELKKALGIRLNRELYLCYFIMYILITRFYNDSGSYNYTEYIKITDVIEAVEKALSGVMSTISVLVNDETEEASFKAIALTWADLPVAGREEMVRAVKTTKAGFIKLILNFFVSQGLLSEVKDRYYPRNRFKALAESYFRDNKGRLFEIMNEKVESKDAPY
ncbi:MAG: hypothetical protein IJW18_01150 [Lachnospiraceae bacterium]|nr:hypothetical protein [Lachnospiraceae bacterium]